MRHEVVVFLGPTLSHADASKSLDAIYRPPAEQGDIVRAVCSDNARAIVLVDGVFAKAPAVRHKEILWALDRGVRVFGASSMGALRAAELHPYGMHGYGLIYRWYRATLLADDDEVAVAMMPSELGANALSDALINIRLTLRAAERQGLLSNTARRQMEDLSRQLHFVDRTYASLFDRARRFLPDEQKVLVDPLREWVERHSINQKRKDAAGLLSLVASLEDIPSPNPADRPPFRMTEAWAADLDASGFDLAAIL